MNPEKLKKLQAQAALVRIGGKGMNYRRFRLFSDETCFCLRFSAIFFFFAAKTHVSRKFVILGTPRRKKKVVHQTAATDDKKLHSTLKKLACNPIAGIEEVNLFKNDGSVIHFNNPRTQASLQSNVFAISGHSESKSVRKSISREIS